MASWYSNILTKTTSQISSLRSTLLSSETDGDTEDDTHVCRVLRNYYTEKGRPFPAWLPPDPKAPVAQAPVQPLYAQAGGAQSARLAPTQQGGAGLSSLWGDGGAQQQQQQAAPQSLRAGRPPGPDGRPMMGHSAPSYQSTASYQSGPPRETTPVGAASAQDRLRQRLRGSRTTSPNQGGQTPFQPPPGGGGGGGGGGGAYEDRFAPQGDNPYGGGSPGGRRPGLPSGPRSYR